MQQVVIGNFKWLIEQSQWTNSTNNNDEIQYEKRINNSSLDLNMAIFLISPFESKLSIPRIPKPNWQDENHNYNSPGKHAPCYRICKNVIRRLTSWKMRIEDIRSCPVVRIEVDTSKSERD